MRRLPTTADAALTLPPRGSAESARWDGRITALLALPGGLLMLGLAPFVPASWAMAAAGAGAVVVALWAYVTPAGARPWVRSAYTACSVVMITLGTYAAEHDSWLRLGSVALLCPVITIACLRSGREVAWQVLWAQSVYAAYLFLTVPAAAAAVGSMASGAIMAMLAALICGLRGRLDLVVEDLREQAETDPLTGLRNRAGLRHGVREVQAAGCAGAAVLLLDLDHFKQVNDVHGHEAGDGVLVWLADLLRTATRPGDIVARHGGEEFVLYLPGRADPAALRVRAESLRARVEAASRERGLPMTVSIGACHRADPDLVALLRAADAELYAAKHAGRNLVRIG